MKTLSVSIEEICLRGIVAIIIGGAIGYERGRSNRPAGFCTHMLVCLGACIVALIQDNLSVYLSNYVMLHPSAKQYFGSNIGRMGEKVVSGIGFLGAGTIIRGRGVIGGLTTAASVWITGCIGFGIGFGYYKMGIISGLTAVIILSIFKKLEDRFIEHRIYSKVIIEFYEDKDYEKDLKETHKLLKSMKVKIHKVRKEKENKIVHYILDIPKQLYGLDFVANVSKYKYIKNVKVL